MNRDTFRNGIEEIYTAHGKAFPAQKVAEGVFERVKDLPDSFMAFAVAELRDYTTLPSNLGRELRRNLWPAYLGKNPQLRAGTEIKGCDLCRSGRAGPGFIYAYNPADSCRVVMFKCVCCTQENVAHWESWDMGKIYEAGLVPGLPQ